MPFPTCNVFIIGSTIHNCKVDLGSNDIERNGACFSAERSIEIARPLISSIANAIKSFSSTSSLVNCDEQFMIFRRIPVNAFVLIADQQSNSLTVARSLIHELQRNEINVE